MSQGMETLAVIGSGTMGSSIANVFLKHHIGVNLIDVSESHMEAAVQKIRFYLESVSDIEDLNYLSTFMDIKQGLNGVDFVIEAISENLLLKQELFKQLDDICPPSVILASNTSSIPITQLAQFVNHKERIVGTHFFTPAEVIPVVEVIKSAYTNNIVFETTSNYLKSVNKRPLLVYKDIPGFVANRMQHALVREAISLVQNGIASVEDVDLVTKYILGVRLPSTGILEQRDLSGLDINFEAAKFIYADLENSKVPLKLHEDKVREGHVGLKAGKGFYEWSNCRKEDVIALKNKQMLKILEIMRAFEQE
jgi:3-hydroxyacyl-CoA dehydrogenase